MSKTIQVIHEEHSSVSAMLQSMNLMIERGPKGNPQRFFEVLRAMLFYIEEFPERLHHPKESEYLFPAVLKHSPELKATLESLECEHQKSSLMGKELQHLLLAWELLGESRKSAFVKAAQAYLNFYFNHMHIEHTVIIPQALKVLSDSEWAAIDFHFESNVDPMSYSKGEEETYKHLFNTITNHAPAPIGLGDD
jgi:hemerythrin-like domain-containing protein